ncbi:hypothetical protein [Pseudomonas capsici]|uniref:hypothetical protein n=1 Tax=Pseudomonas capsici TaxID=2810614 RepID=UPI0013C3539B|nr:hypothetical protein [Pseudomonas capsici]MCV4283866.1 hypothetical protein [Pseudomonas capsici]
MRNALRTPSAKNTLQIATSLADQARHSSAHDIAHVRIFLRSLSGEIAQKTAKNGSLKS